MFSQKKWPSGRFLKSIQFFRLKSLCKATSSQLCCECVLLLTCESVAYFLCCTDAEGKNRSSKDPRHWDPCHFCNLSVPREQNSCWYCIQALENKREFSCLSVLYMGWTTGLRTKRDSYLCRFINAFPMDCLHLNYWCQSSATWCSNLQNDNWLNQTYLEPSFTKVNSTYTHVLSTETPDYNLSGEGMTMGCMGKGELHSPTHTLEKGGFELQ